MKRHQFNQNFVYRNSNTGRIITVQEAQSRKEYSSVKIGKCQRCNDEGYWITVTAFEWAECFQVCEKCGAERVPEGVTE
jgi:hypothetical protein